MRLKPEYRRPPNPPPRVRFALEALEDRCVFSATTFDFHAAEGVRQTLQLNPAADAPSWAGNFLYTGPILTVPSAQAENRTATVSVGDQPALSASLFAQADGYTAIVASPTLAVSENYLVSVQLHATNAADIFYQLQLTTTLTSPTTVTVTTSVLSGFLLAAVPTVPAVPPPASTPPPTVPPIVTGSGGAAGNPQPPPAGNDGPAPQPPPAVPPPPRGGPLPSIQFAEFRAGSTQAAFVSADVPQTVSPSLVPNGTAFQVPQVSARIEASVQRQFIAAPEDVFLERRRPATLELVVTRERQLVNSVEERPLEFLGVAVDAAPRIDANPDVSEVLLRLANQATVEPDGDLRITQAAAPIDRSEPEPHSARSVYFFVAGLIGVGTGRFYLRRRVGLLESHAPVVE